MYHFYQKYKHVIPLILYAVFYLIWFIYIENKEVYDRTVIHMKIDDIIPFCEAFVIPYFLWFLYVPAVLLFCFFRSKPDYYKLCAFLFTGMTIFLVVSTLWPNGHHLRPAILPRSNFFSSILAWLYRIDTPTNLWPSIHVYDSLGAHFAVLRSRELSKIKAVRISSLLSCSLITLSTLFIKQHSMFDVITAFIMAAVMYVTVYHASPFKNSLRYIA